MCSQTPTQATALATRACCTYGERGRRAGLVMAPDWGLKTSVCFIAQLGTRDYSAQIRPFATDTERYASTPLKGLESRWQTLLWADE